MSDQLEPGSLLAYKKDMALCSVLDGGFSVGHNGHTMSGWLIKKGGFRHNWLKRWFKLDDVSRTLEYYEMPGQNRSGLKGTISLAECYLVRTSQHPAADASALEMELVAKERTYRVRALSSPAVFRAWLAAIQSQLNTDCR